MTTKKDTLCIAVDTDTLEEGMSRLYSGYAILSAVSDGICDNKSLCDKLYGVELLLNQSIELIEHSRVTLRTFKMSALPATLTGSAT